MLVVRARRHLGDASLELLLGFAPGLWTNLVARRGLVFDTSFVPAERGAARPGHCLYLLERGCFAELEGGLARRRHEGPCALIFSEEEFEGAHGARRMPYRASGEPLVAFEVHVGPDDLASPRRAGARGLDVPDDVWRLLARLTALPGDADDAPVVAATLGLLEALATAGILRPEAVARAARPIALETLWRGARPLLERLDVAATLDQVGAIADASRRQMDRHARSFFDQVPVVGGAFRAATLHLRLKLAVLLLSAEGVGVTEVARQTGYGSVDAMGRAFRDAGLPAPSSVQAGLAAARAQEANA